MIRSAAFGDHDGRRIRIAALTMRGMTDASTTRSPARHAPASVHRPHPSRLALCDSFHRVIDGVGVIADELLDLRIAARLCRILQLPAPRNGLSAQVARENFAHAAYTAHQALHIVGLGKEGRVYERHGFGIGRGQLHAGPGPLAAADRHGRNNRLHPALFYDRGRPACPPQNAAADRARPAACCGQSRRPPAKLLVSTPWRLAPASHAPPDIPGGRQTTGQSCPSSAGQSTSFCTTSGGHANARPHREGDARHQYAVLP